MPTQTTAELSPPPPPQPPLQPGAVARPWRLPNLQELGLVVVIVLLGLVLTAYGWYDAHPGKPNTFLNFQNLVDGIATPMSYYAIMAVGLTFVIITGGIDISVGSIMALAALGTAAVLQNFGPDSSPAVMYATAIVVPMLIGLLCGLVNGALIVTLNLHPFIVTLGTMAVFRGLANVLPWFHTKTLVVPSHTLAFMRFQVGGLEAMPLIIMLISVGVGWFYLRLMIAGRENYAIGGNEEAARFSGLRVNVVKLRVYALAGLLAGVAGLVSLGRFGTASTSTGTGYELTVIAAAVVGGASLSGGRGSALGALLGTLVIALIQNGIYVLRLQEEYRLVITGVAIVLAAALDRVSEMLRQRRLKRSSSSSSSAGGGFEVIQQQPGGNMKQVLTVLAVVTMLSFTGCKKEDTGGGGGGAAGGGERRKIVIGVVAKSQSNAVFQAAHAGARDAAKELGAKYGVDVEVDIRTPTDEDATKQAEAVEALTRQGVDGITVSCSEAATVTPAIDKAVARSIPVMCFDSDAPQSKRFAYYGTDDRACGMTVMRELSKAMNGAGTIAILAGNQSAPNLQARVAGVREELKNHPNIKELNNGSGVFYHQETPEKAAEAVANAVNANPAIQGWAMIGGWPLFTTDALKWPAGQIKVVSVDALPAQLGYLKSGHVEVLLAQDCYGWGHRSVEILLEKIVNNKAPDSTRVIDPLQPVTRETADEFGKNWEKWLKR